MAGTATLAARDRHQVTSLLDECFDTLGEAHNENVYAAIERLVQAGEFTVHDLIRMLKGGMSLEALLDLIELRMTGICVQSESMAA
jgi:hypothetical protein